MQLRSFLKKAFVTSCNIVRWYLLTVLHHHCSPSSRKSLYMWSYFFTPFWINSQWVLNICTWTETSQGKKFSLELNSLPASISLQSKISVWSCTQLTTGQGILQHCHIVI